MSRYCLFVLGVLLETALRRSLILFGGDPTGFVTRPISGTLVAILVAVIAFPVIAKLWKSKTREKELV